MTQTTLPLRTILFRLAMAPIMGLLFAMFLPFIGIAMFLHFIVTSAWRTLVRTWNGQAQAVYRGR
jgi:hypothetical protein